MRGLGSILLPGGGGGVNGLLGRFGYGYFITMLFPDQYCLPERQVDMSLCSDFICHRIYGIVFCLSVTCLSASHTLAVCVPLRWAPMCSGYSCLCYPPLGMSLLSPTRDVSAIPQGRHITAQLRLP